MNFTRLEETNITDAGELLAYPNSGDFFFWGKLLLALWFVIGLSLFFKEQKDTGRGNFLSAFAVSSVVTIVLSFAGSLIGIVTKEIFTSTLIIGGIMIFIWYVNDN